MLGILFGTACLIGLIAVLRAHHREHGFNGHGPWAHHFGGCHGGWHGGWHGRVGHNPVLRGLFVSLDTTPGQEKTIRAAVEDLFGAVRGAKESLWQSRGNLAQVFRSESFDEQALAGVISRHDEALESVRGRAVDVVARVYEVLDTAQRERVAQWLESGLGRAGRRHPYRTPPAGE
jgi:Spy/CpxP family protein refolding chaperone